MIAHRGCVFLVVFHFFSPTIDTPGKKSASNSPNPKPRRASAAAPAPSADAGEAAGLPKVEKRPPTAGRRAYVMKSAHQAEIINTHTHTHSNAAYTHVRDLSQPLT